jgi:hypothetical protein
MLLNNIRLSSRLDRGGVLIQGEYGQNPSYMAQFRTVALATNGRSTQWICVSYRPLSGR